MSYLDSLDLECEMLYQQIQTCTNEDTKKWLEQLLEDKTEQYKAEERELIERINMGMRESK